MIIDTLNRLNTTGELDDLVCSGLMRDNVFKKIDVYLFFNKELLTSEDKPTAVTFTAETKNVSEPYVYKVIAQMERSVKVKRKGSVKRRTSG